MSNIGPQLPPHLIKNQAEDEEEDVGPSLPQDVEKRENDGESDGKGASYGPMLPPGFNINEPKKKVIGPALPPHLTRKDYDETNKSDDDDDDEDNDDDIGPNIPLSFVQDEDTNEERLRKEFEERADAMKDKLEGKSDASKGKLQRESWMTELPDAWSKNFGTGPRKFRTNHVDVGDQSVWTDTPADKERKRQEAIERAKANNSAAGEKRKAEASRQQTRQPTAEEKEMEERVAAYNQQSRPQSLLEMHREKRKKSDESASKIRRPFDRDRDLSFHRHDSKSKSRIIDQAKGLNSKFSKGTYESKFL